MDGIYREAFDELVELLEKTVRDFTNAHENTTMVPLFSITNRKLELVEAVDYFCKNQLLNVCKELLYKVSSSCGLDVSRANDNMNIDFIIVKDNYKEGFAVVRNGSFMPEIETEIEAGINKITNIVLKEATNDEPIFFKPNSDRYKKYIYKNCVNNITIKQYYEYLETADYNDFLELVDAYNYQAEQLLGMTVSCIPTEIELKKHRILINTNLSDDFFYSNLLNLFTEKELDVISKQYNEKYTIMLSERDFANSFISSEWFFRNHVETEGFIDYTAIVAGYLKSVEQLLCAVLLSLSDNNQFLFQTNTKGRSETGKDELPLSNENLDLIQTMAGNMLNVIKKEENKNIVMHSGRPIDKILKYLKEYVYKTRNGYLHKDNLYNWEDVIDIRKKTYGAYFVILGSMKYEI